MKLLFIAEKKLHRTLIKKEFEKIKTSMPFSIDVATANCFITSDEDAERCNLNTDNFEELSSKLKNAPKHFKVFCKEEPSEVLPLINNNEYDFLVNACGADKAGELMFDYVRESCNLTSYKTLVFDIASFLLGSPAKAFEDIKEKLSSEVSKE